MKAYLWTFSFQGSGSNTEIGRMKTERQGLLFLPQAGLQKKNQVQLEHIYATNQEVDIKKKYFLK